MQTGSFSCRNHPSRPGIGVCPACATTICEECSTRLDGVLHCRNCLLQKTSSPKGSAWRSLSALAPAAVLTPMAYWAVAWMIYSLALLTTWSAGLWDRLQHFLE